MRIWHLLALVATAAVVLALLRSALGVIFLVWTALFLVLYWADRWVRRQNPEWQFPILTWLGMSFSLVILILILELSGVFR